MMQVTKVWWDGEKLMAEPIDPNTIYQKPAPDFWEGYVPEPDKRQQALDKKAENARELGLDYEPAQQEPVAIVDANDEGYWAEILPDRSVKVGQLLYTSPPAQRTWVSLTDEQMLAIVHYSQLDNARAIEAKLKEKNA